MKAVELPRCEGSPLNIRLTRENRILASTASSVAALRPELASGCTGPPSDRRKVSDCGVGDRLSRLEPGEICTHAGLVVTSLDVLRRVFVNSIGLSFRETA
jgi:hypothetical protein